MLKMLQVGQLGDLIIRYIQHTKLKVSLEARDLLKRIVRYVELFEIYKRIKSSYCWKTV